MRTLTTLIVGALLMTVAPGMALAAPAAAPTGSHVSTTTAPSVPAAQADCSFPVTRTDATGTEVTVEESPERVVVLAESAAQTMWELDEEDRVVGMPVGPYSSYLEGYDNRTNIRNDDGTVNTEQVVGLEPDLVLAPNVIPNETVSQLRDAGLTVYKTGFGRTLGDITEKVTLYGRFTGACEQAATVNAEFNATLEEIRANAPEQSPRVYYYFFNFTTGNGTFIHEAIETAGGDNIAANAGVNGFKQVNREVVAARNPQWVIRPSGPGSTFPSGEPWDSTAAYRLNQTLVVDRNLISQPGPRVVEPMQNMSEAFQNTETLDTPTATEADGDEPTATAASEETPDAETNSGGQPGFGAVTVLVAAVLGLLALARRDR